MRSCVVVGCGRSGTSLAAGILAESGCDPGADLVPADSGGPTGFFESRQLNAINERLLAPYDDMFLWRAGYSRQLREGERWLAVLPWGADPSAPQHLGAAMRAAVPSAPYCCKDPRFGYTLPSWRPFFRDALFVCIFRHPLATATSIAREVRYGDLTVTIDAAIELWSAIYRRVLERHRHAGDWLFLHYEQLFDRSGLERLSHAVGARLDAGLADPALRRPQPVAPPPAATIPIYEELCAEAGHRA